MFLNAASDAVRFAVNDVAGSAEVDGADTLSVAEQKADLPLL
jgi:hypothetical protein